MKTTLHLFLLRKCADIYIAAKPFQPKGTVLLRNRVVIVFPRGREPARYYLRCLIKSAPSLLPYMSDVWLPLVNESLFWITYNALNCIVTRKKIWEKEQNTRECIKIFLFCFIFAMCALEEEGRTSFKHSWCVCHVILFKRILVVYKTM